MKKIIITLIVSTIIITACSAPATPDQGQVETMVASTLEAHTQTAPDPAGNSGLFISIDGLSLTIPVGLANGLIVENVEAALPADDMPWWGTYPAHKTYPLQGYLLTDTFHDAKIYIFPIAEYTAMNEDVGKKVQTLQGILNDPAAPLPDRLPFLPTWNAGEVFHSNFERISFQNGSGIRYLTQYGQAPLPVNNQEIFYTFQGLTSDGLYYIAVTLPINVAFLTQHANPEAPVPADGVPFDWENFMNNESHYVFVANKLNTADPASFTPTLPALDSLVNSIQVSGNP